jgi:exosortase
VPKRSVSATTSGLPIQDRAWIPAGVRRGVLPPNVVFGLLVALSAAWSWQPLAMVVTRSLDSGEYEHYSHIILLPFFSAYLLFLNRHAILERARPGLSAGLAVMAAGAAAVWIAGTPRLISELDLRLSLAMAGLVTLWAGSFVVAYGVRAFRTATFPFAMLLFMVPLPAAALTAVIVFLQHASADASHVLFGVIGMPVFRDGIVFALPGLTIRVAEECSGIRSSLALLVSGVSMAYLLLRSPWTRTALVLAIVPIAIVKNAMRIVGLSWLAIHVDPSFITGSAVHRNGGIPLFLVSLVLLGGLAWLFRRYEGWKSR